MRAILLFILLLAGPVGAQVASLVGAWDCKAMNYEIAFFDDGSMVMHSDLKAEGVEIMVAGSYKLMGKRLERTDALTRFLKGPFPDAKRWAVSVRSASTNNSNFNIFEYEVLSITPQQLRLRTVRKLNWDRSGPIDLSMRPMLVCEKAPHLQRSWS